MLNDIAGELNHILMDLDPDSVDLYDAEVSRMICCCLQ